MRWITINFNLPTCSAAETLSERITYCWTWKLSISSWLPQMSKHMPYRNHSYSPMCSMNSPHLFCWNFKRELLWGTKKFLNQSHATVKTTSALPTRKTLTTRSTSRRWESQSLGHMCYHDRSLMSQCWPAVLTSSTRKSSRLTIHCLASCHVWLTSSSTWLKRWSWMKRSFKWWWHVISSWA